MVAVAAAGAMWAAVAVGAVGSVGQEAARVAVAVAAAAVEAEAEADGAVEAGVTVAAITRIADLSTQSTVSAG